VDVVFLGEKTFLTAERHLTQLKGGGNRGTRLGGKKGGDNTSFEVKVKNGEGPATIRDDERQERNCVNPVSGGKKAKIRDTTEFPCQKKKLCIKNDADTNFWGVRRRLKMNSWRKT